MSEFATRREDLRTWQQPCILANEVYDVFASSRDYGFRGQIQRAAVLSMNSIAEGFERTTSKGDGLFLNIRKASPGAVSGMLFLGVNRTYLSTVSASSM